jgi:hypothetical protein
MAENLTYIVIYAQRYKSGKAREVRRKVLYYLCISYRIYISYSNVFKVI